MKMNLLAIVIAVCLEVERKHRIKLSGFEKERSRVLAKNIALAQLPCCRIGEATGAWEDANAWRREGGEDAPHLSDARKSARTEKNQHNMSQVSHVSHPGRKCSKYYLQIPPITVTQPNRCKVTWFRKHSHTHMRIYLAAGNDKLLRAVV